MGNCGSSLECTEYDTQIEINPDIAGIGVLISFYFGAIGLSVVLIWAYLTGCLPPDILAPIDHYAVQALHQFNKTRSYASGKINLDFRPTPKQTRRPEVVVGFVKVLSDQQLITSIAILTAGLASRCQISIYEFNIVTCLAYFAEHTHFLSLGVLQTYLYHHKLVRNCRVTFTIGFLILFGFSFIINSAGTTEYHVGFKLQCVFDALKHGEYVHFNSMDAVYLAFLLYNHTIGLVNLYHVPGTESIGGLMHTFCVTYLRKIKELSVWFFFEEYYKGYGSALPIVCMGVGYGMGSTISAIWSGEVELKDGLQIFGFGQIVAIGLLALTILAATEIVNEQWFLDARTPSRELGLNPEISEMNHDVSTDISEGGRAPEEANVTSNNDRTDSFFLNRLVRFWARKSNNDLAAVRSGKTSISKLDEITARKIGHLAILYGLVESCIFGFCGVGWHFEITNLPATTTFFTYVIYCFLLCIKRTLNLIYFIHDEFRLLQIQQRSESQLELVRPSSEQLATALVPSGNASLHSNVPSLTRANNQEAELQYIVEEEQMVSGQLDRQGTEADIGLVPPTRRSTFRSVDMDENSHG